MSDVIRVHAELAIKDGQLDALKAVRDKLVEASSKEDGTVGYEWSISEDQKTVHVAERYQSSEQLMVHLGSFGAHFADFGGFTK